MQGATSGMADFAQASQKRSSQVHSKPIKRKRVVRKKPEIVELDDEKDEVEVVKPAAHWKDHWVIQLISIRGEMHSIFSATPKQGDVHKFNFSFFFFFLFSALNYLYPHYTPPTRSSCIQT
jgi:hypothetical protein